MNRVLGALILVCGLVGSAVASPIRNDVRRVAPPTVTSNVVNSHVLFLNNCQPNGCTVNVGGTDARTHSSELVNATSHLSAFPFSATAWSSVVSCVKASMAPFNLTVTDVDPGTAEHFEVMVAGSSAQLQTSPPLGNNSGGVAPLPCTNLGVCSYIPNALVFDFASIWGSGSSCNSACVLNVCATAAQEIGHAWTLDHVVDGTDPMSYNLQYNPGQPHFHDHEVCGSDCISGQSPLQLTCSSQNDMTATHTCFSTGTGSQDELATILGLFGANGAVPPTVAITSPSNGAAVAAGFAVKATCTANGDAIAEVQLVIDSVTKATLTAAPFNFTAPASLANGSHTVDVVCTTTNQAQATATVTVTQGASCTVATDCADKTDICFKGACVPGSGAPGGLGATCTKNTDCTSMECANSSSGSFCVVPCDPGASDSCPSSFGCVMAGAGSVCFPGADSGGGGCSTSSSSGPIVFGLGFAALLLTRRRGGSR